MFTFGYNGSKKMSSSNGSLTAIYLNAKVSQHFLLIDQKISFGDITVDKSSSLTYIQHENQNAASYGCRENVTTAQVTEVQYFTDRVLANHYVYVMTV